MRPVNRLAEAAKQIRICQQQADTTTGQADRLIDLEAGIEAIAEELETGNGGDP